MDPVVRSLRARLPALAISILGACAAEPTTSQLTAAVTPELGVTSTVTYSTRPSQSGSFSDPVLYRTRFDELMSTLPDIGGHCSETVLPMWAGVTNRGTCGGTGTGFASRTRVELSVPPALAGTWQILVRPDYGLGGAVFLDGRVIAHNPGDMWEGIGQVFNVEVAMTAGLHVLEAYGVENCCDGQNAGEYRPPGGALQPFVTTPTPPCPTQGYAPSCTPRCRALVTAANAISDRAIAGATHFTRGEYLTLFSAVECRTGVPASVLKAIATSEGLATYHEDPYPRQFVEPCEESWNLSERFNGWSYPELFSRYYGANGWPLLAFDAPASFQCGSGASCSCPPTQPAAFVLPLSPGRAPDPPPACTTPPPLNAAWTPLWPSVSHVVLGDDRMPGGTGNQSFGIGIMQATFAISNIVQPVAAGRATYVASCYAPAAGPIYPFGGTPAAGSVPIEPLASLLEVARDPQFNILLAAELILYKAQFAEGNKVRSDAALVACKLTSDRYGLTLAAGPNAPQVVTGANSWAFQGAQYKTTNSCATTACVQQYIESVILFTPSTARDAGCFAPSPQRTRTNAAGTACLDPVGHRFATEDQLGSEQ